MELVIYYILGGFALLAVLSAIKEHVDANRASRFYGDMLIRRARRPPAIECPHCRLFYHRHTDGGPRKCPYCKQEVTNGKEPYDHAHRNRNSL